MKKPIDIIIIGAGAGGLMLGALLGRKKDFLILEYNSQIGSKILISGGGRCNFTNKNLKVDNYLGDREFIKPVLMKFNQNRVLEWFRERGLSYKLQKNSQYFCENSSKEIVDIFKKEIDNRKIKLNTKVISVTKKDEVFKVETNRGDFFAKKVVVASGGLSFAKVGATDIGYKIAKGFGHNISTLNPALVGFTLQPHQFFFKELSGVSTEVEVLVGEKRFRGSMLFTHRGISGPVILNASLYWLKGKITIDFLPHLDIEKVKLSKKYISRALNLPNRFSKAFLKELGIKDKSAFRLNTEEFKKISTLKEYSFSPAGTFGYNKAEVTKGGISTSEVYNSNMMSKLEDNLYFLGEVLDVTGELGGYNFQWAFSTAYVCAKAI
jgi:predicted Rossmann fold flavoprotein